MIKKPTFNEEQLLWGKGYEYVIGVDEVGRGAFAGPVVVGAVSFPYCHLLSLAPEPWPEQVLGSVKIDDSKRLSPKMREKAVKWIEKNASCYSMVQISVSIINKYGITKATHVAFRKAIKNMQRKFLNDSNHRSKSLFVLVDGFHIKYIRGIGLKNQLAIIKGDQKSVSIAAASILAKVYRDELMKKLDKKYPQYGFAKHKGYGTKEHQEALKKNGLSKIHRRSFNLSRFVI